MSIGNTPTIDQVVHSFSTNSNNEIALLRVNGSIQANIFSAGNTVISQDSISMPTGNIGGITLNNGTITSNDLSLVSTNNIINCNGATLINVGGISSNPNNYTVVFSGFQTNPSQTVLAGSITLPSGGCVCILDPEFIATRNTGMSAVGNNPQKVNFVGGVMSFVDYRNSAFLADDPAVSMTKITLVQSGNSVNIMATGADLYVLSWVITVIVTVVGL